MPTEVEDCPSEEIVIRSKEELIAESDREMREARRDTDGWNSVERSYQLNNFKALLRKWKSH